MSKAILALFMFASVPCVLCFMQSSGCWSSFALKMAGFGTAQLKKSETNKAPTLDSLCACGTGKSYRSCCQPYHTGAAVPPEPVDVVRSRFSALSYCLPDYLLKTTHPKNTEFVAEDRVSKRKQWIKSLRAFSEEYEFVELLFESETGTQAVPVDGSEGKVEISFVARLRKDGAERTEDVTEKSVFAKDASGAWLYLDAEINNPFKNVDVTPVKKNQRMVTTAKRGVGRGN